METASKINIAATARISHISQKPQQKNNNFPHGFRGQSGRKSSDHMTQRVNIPLQSYKPSCEQSQGFSIPAHFRLWHAIHPCKLYYIDPLQI